MVWLWDMLGVGGKWTCWFPAWSLVNSFTSFHPDLEVLYWTLIYGHFLGLGVFFGLFSPCLEGYLLLQAELTRSYFKHPVGLSGRNQPNQRACSGPGSLLNSRLEPAASPASPTKFLSLLGTCVLLFVSFLIQPNLTFPHIGTLHKSCWVAATRSFSEVAGV